jgi:hypothetical protein
MSDDKPQVAPDSAKPETIKLVLKHPIQVEGKSVTELALRTDVRARDFFAGDGVKGETEKAARISARLANVPPSAIGDMRAEDFVRLMEIVGPLLLGGPATSATSPATSP